MDRFNNSQNVEQRGRPVSSLEAARANDAFEAFLNASTLKLILGTYRAICEHLHLKPNAFPQFYPKLKSHLTSWRAKALWKKFDARASNKCYGKGKLCQNTRVLIIGAGPCGLRTAIEAQLLGAKVVVVEKRDRMSRNNVLHLWPFVIDDLRLLGAKKFFGRFCAGSIDHISIRQLQCILLKAALLLGVEIHTDISFERLVEPNAEENTGWHAEFKPKEHPLSQFEFDVVVGADGKRNTLQGFKRKEFRGKLAIAITANFINKRTEAEARVEEISGVAFIFNQKFFKDLYAQTGIDLENIVYYKDDTHYFVMTAKKQSLIDKGVIKQDLSDTAKLLAPDNVDKVALMNYAQEAAEFSTNYKMLNLEFAVNHYGQPDVAMFDFTSMYQAENASRIIERCGYKLLSVLVGDSLLEPFWPTGSGCARGFLSSLDAGWAIRSYGSTMQTALEVIAERESIYRLLPQTTPENLNRDYKSYTLDPSTRYPNLNRNVLTPPQVLSLYDTDDPQTIELSRTPMIVPTEVPKKRRRRETHVDPDTLLTWIKDQVKEHTDLQVNDITTSFKDGRVISAIINHYRPDLLDYASIKADEPVKTNQIAFDILEKEIGITPVMTGEEMANAVVPDFLTMLAYLTQIYDTFRGEVPHIKYMKLKCKLAKSHPATPVPLLLLHPPAPPKHNSERPFEKSKFSIINRMQQNSQKHINHTLAVGELNLTPIKSIEESNLKKKIDNVSTSNSKSLTMKLSHNDIKLLLPVKQRSKKISKRKYSQAKYLRDQIQKNLNLLTKSAYLMESQLLQIKIDAAFKYKWKINPSEDKKNEIENNHSSISLKEAKGKYEIGIQTDQLKKHNDAELKHQSKDNNLCCCCEVNKRSILTKCSKSVEEIDVSVCKHKISFNSINNCVRIIFPRIVRTLKHGLNLVSNDDTFIPKSRERYYNFEVSKFLSLANMSHSEPNNYIEAEQTFERVVNWLSHNNFEVKNDSPKSSTIYLDHLTDITSVTHTKPQDGIIVETTNEILKFTSDGCGNIKHSALESASQLLDEIKITETKMAQKFNKLMLSSPRKMYKKRFLARSEPFLIINENDEHESPEIKQRVEPAFTKNHPAIKQTIPILNAPSTATTHRPSTRHKRHVDPVTNKSSVAERKPRKRRTLEKITGGNTEERIKRLEEISANRNERQNKRREQRRMQTEQFIKSMQMLQANSKLDESEPFEDYSIFLYRQTAPNFEDRVKDLEKKFTYIPDHDSRVPAQTKYEKDDEFQARIKGMEEKCCDTTIPVHHKSKVGRPIGKIESSDWNIKQIEKKIHENKLGKNVNKDKERVPKWNREQFLARQTKMEKQHLERQDSSGSKYAEIDKNIKQLDLKLKEGTNRDVNRQKVAMITEKLKPKEPEAKPIQKSNSKTAVVLPTQGNSEVCHFCLKRVYLMERLSAEGRFFHRGCFRCQYCQTLLRLGSYLFDRDGKYGYRFYCSQHFGMSGELKTTKLVRKPSQKEQKSPEKKAFTGVTGVDLLDRVQTPERIEFANLSAGQISSDHEETLSQMDEDEWTDRNFGASTAEIGSSDDDSSSLSDTDSDDEDAYEEALEEPPTKEGTLKWAERYNRRYSKKHDDSDSESYSSSDRSSYYENSSGDDDSDTATEGEEEILARALRKQEVNVKPGPQHLCADTTDTEIASDDTSLESSSEVQNSATEISTDSEFAHDDPTPTREVPSIALNDTFVTKTRGRYITPQKVQIKSTEIHKTSPKMPQEKDIKLKFTPLVPTPIIKPTTLMIRNEGYALNRTQSTGGIATKVSLELKKKYLLGETNTANSIQKSGSASTLDSKFKSFHSTISDCQKLLKPAPEISASMQTFCNKLNERTSPLSPIPSNIFKEITSKTEIKTDIPEQPEKSIKEALETEKENDVPYENEGRPRSPLHETSIIVPKIDWAHQKQQKSDNSTESSTSSTSSSSEVESNDVKIKTFNNIPRLEIENVDTKENVLVDSLNYDINYVKLESQPNSINEPKSISSEKKSLNQPKTLPNLDSNTILSQVHTVLHAKSKPEENTEKSSGRSTPSNCDDPITAVLTETELSDWARDGMVSDDFEEDYEAKQERQARKSKINTKKSISIDKIEDVKHVCGNNQTSQEEKVECINNILNPHLDNIEFMDTGSESSDEGLVEVKNNGYVQFHDEDDMAEDSLSPAINVVLETRNPKIKATFDEDFDDISTVAKNTGYCIIETKMGMGDEMIDSQHSEQKDKQRANYENEDDSLIIVDASTTTDDITCSDSTVKNVTQFADDKDTTPEENLNENQAPISTTSTTTNTTAVSSMTSTLIENNNTLDKKRLEDKLAQIKKDMKKLNEQRKAEEEQNLRNNIEFEQHCQRLKSKVDFGNAKDSIDVRKSRRQSKTGSPPKPDLIQEEKAIASPTRSKKEQIEIERDLNKKLIQEMVMNKMRAENKSLERKRRTRNSFSPSLSPSRPYELTTSPTVDISSTKMGPTPDVLLSTMNPVQKSQTVGALSDFNKSNDSKLRLKTTGAKTSSRPLSVHSSFLPRAINNEVHTPKVETPKTSTEAFSLPDIQKALTTEFQTPQAPPRCQRNQDAIRTVEKLKEDARARARLLTDEDLGLSPEEKLARLRQKFNRRGKENDLDVHMHDNIEPLENRNTLIYTNDTLSKKKNLFKRSKSGEDQLKQTNQLNNRDRTKSVSDVNKTLNVINQANEPIKYSFKSDPNLLMNYNDKKDGGRKKKPPKDRERRKSITKLFTDLFAKKKDSVTINNSSSKGFLARISPKTKDKSKDIIIKEEPVRRLSFVETRSSIPRNVSPPPIPPLPLNYTGSKSMDESSDCESEWKKQDRSSCDTLDQSGLQEGSISSRTNGRSARKAARQSQLKRHRMAQEIQRKLEETEVKTRELEMRGVNVEKALRGEAEDCNKEESELLKEWFDLMRDMTELRRYEHELMIRAQELELEDRHARLQHELKIRLSSDGQKTKEEVETEGSIIKEMMDIVAKRDSLIVLLKEDRLRYSEEDKGFEEQMLAKGINLTPIMKVTDK